MFSLPYSEDHLGLARESVLLNYKAYLRNTSLAEIVWQNKQAVLSAGTYKDPAKGLNEATSEYLAKLDFTVAKIAKPQEENNQQLYEEWKSIFGKIDD